jgi:hypothetical protein
LVVSSELVVDSLILQIAQSYNFDLVAADSRRSSAGDIQITIELVEKAQIIKVSAQWNCWNEMQARIFFRFTKHAL